ncbi:MAG: outer membrane protein assembly factor BamB family protein [Paracoccaceae bacterium]
MRRAGLWIAALALAGCAEQELLLEGERLDLDGNPIPVEVVNRAAPLPLPRAVANTSWTHVGGSTRHQIIHPALGSSLSVAWSVPIGQGNGRKHRISADPVVENGRVFTLDSRARVSATSTRGQPLWSVDLTPATDGADEGSGGGLAVAGSRVFATNGFGELTALDAATGRVLWRHDFDAGAAAPPTVADGVVYAVTTNATGWALSADTGRVLWQVVGASAERSGVGAPAPVIAGPLVVFPFSSGQMVSAVTESGAQAWAASVAGQRLGQAASVLTDLTGGPVFADNRVFAGSYAGRAAAFDATTGASIWQADEGASGPIWLAGGSLFFVSDRNQLLRVDATTGETIWTRDLPFFTRDRIRRRKALFLHNGPVLAGGRLVVASNDGVLRQFNPVNGDLIGTSALPSGAATNPVVAGRTLFVVSDAGELLALR